MKRTIFFTIFLLVFVVAVVGSDFEILSKIKKQCESGNVYNVRLGQRFLIDDCHSRIAYKYYAYKKEIDGNEYILLEVISHSSTIIILKRGDLLIISSSDGDKVEIKLVKINQDYSVSLKIKIL